MNERIRELAEIAGITTNLHPDVFNKEAVDWINGCLEKFAKLVVQECIEQLEVSKERNPYTGLSFPSARNTILDEEIEELKEYFDVEYR